MIKFGRNKRPRKKLMKAVIGLPFRCGQCANNNLDINEADLVGGHAFIVRCKKCGYGAVFFESDNVSIITDHTTAMEYIKT